VRSPARTSRPPFCTPEDLRYLIDGVSTIAHYEVADAI
jgi:hypothetical protein